MVQFTSHYLDHESDRDRGSARHRAHGSADLGHRAEDRVQGRNDAPGQGESVLRANRGNYRL